MNRIIAIVLSIIALSMFFVAYKSLPQGAIPKVPSSAFPIRLPFWGEEGPPTSRLPLGGKVAEKPVEIVAKTGGTGAGVIKAPSQPIVTTPKPIVSPKPKSFVGVVKIRGVYFSGYTTEYSGVSLIGADDEPVDITGWKIKSNKDSFIIPKAFRYYGSEGESDIVVRKDGEVQIFSHTGVVIPGFATNKCWGYLERSYNFEPSIYGSCPNAEIGTARLTGECQDYLGSLGGCEVPSADPPIRHDDSACFEVLRKLNYASCAATHKSDPDYLTGNWYVWLGDSFGRGHNIFDSRHDTVQLITQKGEVVDEYAY